MNPPSVRVVVEVSCGALHFIFGVDVVMQEVVVHLLLPLKVLLGVMSTIEMELIVVVVVEVARVGGGGELGACAFPIHHSTQGRCE